MALWQCLCICFLLLPLCIFGGGGEGKKGRQEERPQLEKNRVLPLSSTVASEYYENLLTTLTFDQDIYVNDPFLCPGQEEDCVKTTCEPCDWSGDMPTDCTNPNCCGPAQYPQFPSYNHINDWCNSSLPSFTKLQFNEPSEEFSLGEGEYQYFRFFVGEEEYCRSIHVEITTHFGDLSLGISKFVAYPDQKQLKTIENGEQFEASSMERINPGAQYGQSVLTICPNVNPSYERGTFSIAVFGFHERNVASITIHLGEERYPIAPPEDRILCDDLSDDIFEMPPFTNPFFPWNGNVCLEEGVTSEQVIPPREWWDFVLPIRPGCREISFSYNGFTNTNMNPFSFPDSHLFIACGVSGDFTVAGNEASSLIMRFMEGFATWYISACFEEVTYLHCSITTNAAPGNSKLYWSSESKPIRHKISEATPGMLTTYLGRNQAGAVQRSLNYQGYFDWGLFGWSWLSQPTNDPLIFYPPDARYTYNYTEDPLETYFDAGFVEKKGNILNFVDLTSSKETELRSRDTLLQEGFIYIMGITGATGLPVELCNDNDFENGKCGRGSPLAEQSSWTDFLTTRTFSSLNIVTDLGCNGENYIKQNNLVQNQVQDGLISSDFDVLAQKAFLVDLYNAGLTRTGCVMTMERALETEVDNITKIQKTYCPYERNDLQWVTDPCCNVRAEPAFCCSPTTLFIEDDLYTGNDIDFSQLSCQNPECDESFFADIATSLNTIGNPLIGCASGLQDPEYQLSVSIEEAMAEFVRPCLVKSGYGDTFSGVECKKQEDCAFLDTTCDLSSNYCRPKTTQEIRNIYFDCFFDNMPPFVEEYIRTQVLSPADYWFPKDSDYFKKAVRDAATKFDCLGSDPFDLIYGERYIADAALYCKGEGLGIYSNAIIEAQETYINELCPQFLCLGERSCRWEEAKRCKTPLDQVGCFDSFHSLFSPSLSSCPLSETYCSSSSSLSSSSCEKEYECVVCLSVGVSCVVVEGVDSEEECSSIVACEVPGGGIRYDLTEQECLNFGECSSPCDGQSCRSVDEKKGVCVVVGVVDCFGVGGVVFEGECVLTGVEDVYACEQAGIQISSTTEWYMCENMDILECNNPNNFTAPYKYLRCFVDIFRECENEDECLASGTCSDISVTKNIIPTPTGWFIVSYGTCLSSGTLGETYTNEPYCLVVVGETQFLYGCYHRGATEQYCNFLSSPDSFLNPYWTAWITPARTEETCRQEIQGRYGCAIPNEYEKTFWFWQKEDCECKQGTGDYLFEWAPGTWEHGIPHSLSWAQKEVIQKYMWEETISLVEMEKWVRDAVENSFVYALKSQLVCEGNYVASSLSTLVCDCVEESDDCYNSDIETEVGVMGACANETSILKGPPSFTTFSQTSINELCTEATLLLIQRSWFLFPRSPPSVSFQFSERKEQGVVINKNGAEVGEVMGDGSHITFQKPQRVNHFYTCLLISQNDQKNTYTKKDFGRPINGFTAIQPMNIDKIEERKEELLLYWCANITEGEWKEGGEGEGEEGVTVFPIVTLEDYDDEEDEFLSHRTESLLYTLAALYIFDLIIIVIFLFVMFKKHTLNGKQLPLITYLGVVLFCVCIFRIVFCFVYVNDGFSELSEYVVFEIPTFLLFTGVILVLVLFMQLSKKNTFDFRSQDKRIWIFGFVALGIVWSLLIIVTIVYSEVILEENNDSVCPGRVQSNNDDQEEDTRTLTIVYQTIIIFLTLLFALAFWKQSFKLFKMSKNSGTKAKVFIFRLGIITVTSFLLRCILFIILLASDLTSDIYLFITLFLTEIVMILLIALELNKGFYTQIAGVVADTMITTSRTATRSSSSVAGISKQES